MSRLISNFQQEYQKLNLEQKQAVDTIEGPVIVIAGAGTGKTQTISLRIAKILLETQVNPENILALTYTESGVASMRQRLISLIGPTAFSLKLHTFHSFCNELVLIDPESFGLSPQSTSASDLERIDLIRQCIDLLPVNSRLKPWGDTYYYEKDIATAIQTLKREAFSPEKFQELIAAHQKSLDNLLPFYDYLKSLRASPKTETAFTNFWEKFSPPPSLLQSLLDQQFFLKQNGFFTTPGQFKSALTDIFEDLIAYLPKHRELQLIYTNYQKKMTEIFRYDYDDMISLVLNRLQNDNYYRQSLQEKYNYILVDEYQDTNSAQNEIIYKLCPKESPNIFVVGDDSQSIFRFQGAALENIYQFYKHFSPEVTTITLKDNYRSQAHILAISQSLISKNTTRIENLIPTINKNLNAKSLFPKSPIKVVTIPSPVEEAYWIVEKIKNLLSTGVLPRDISIITRRNQDARDICQYLDNQNLPYFLESGQNILTDGYINSLFLVFKAILSPDKQNLTYLYALKAPTQDLFNFTHQGQESPALEKINKKIGFSQKDIARYHPHTAFLKILKRFHLFSQNYLNLVKLKTLSQEFQALSSNKSFSEIVNYLLILQQTGTELKSEVSEAFKSDKIRIMTAHKAKGQEFEHVFILSANDTIWGNTQDRNKIKLPPGILALGSNSLNAGDKNEDERRLFYVALTRAKKELFITSSATPSLFISEINPDLVEKINPEPQPLTALSQYFNFSIPSQLNQDFQTHLTRYLKENYLLTATDVNSYLRCPFCFYYEKIIKIPTQKSKHVLLGTAIHFALSRYYRNKLDQAGLLQAFKSSLTPFKFPNNSEYEEALIKGEGILTDYFEKIKNQSFHRVQVEHNFRSENLTIQGVPVTGNIDKITYNADKITICDFKTGNPDDSSRRPDYERQLLFYYLLFQQSRRFLKKPNTLMIEYVEKSKYTHKFKDLIIPINSEKLEEVKTIIQSVYSDIISLKFQQLGSKCQDPHQFHSFFPTNFKLS